MVMQIVIKLSG